MGTLGSRVSCRYASNASTTYHDNIGLNHLLTLLGGRSGAHMKSKIPTITALLLIAPLLLAYLPGNWIKKHADNDAEQSDMIAVVRVVGLRMEEEAVMKEKGLNDQWHNTIYRGYVADLLVLDCIKQDSDPNLQYRPGSRIALGVGGDLCERADDVLKIDPAPPALSMHNTQNGYDLRIGQTYLIFFSKSKDGPEPFYPRSGPHSIYWLQPNDIYRRKGLSGYGEEQEGWMQLLADLRGNQADAQP